MGIIKQKLYGKRQGMQKQCCLQQDAAEAACVNDNSEQGATDRRRAAEVDARCVFGNIPQELTHT